MATLFAYWTHYWPTDYLMMTFRQPIRSITAPLIICFQLSSGEFNHTEIWYVSSRFAGRIHQKQRASNGEQPKCIESGYEKNTKPKNEIYKWYDEISSNYICIQRSRYKYLNDSLLCVDAGNMVIILTVDFSSSFRFSVLLLLFYSNIKTHTDERTWSAFIKDSYGKGIRNKSTCRLTMCFLVCACVCVCFG